MPNVFLCHASEDKALALRLATDLVAANINTFYDQWEIRSGDSIRQKIDAGIGDCTHFLVLLTPRSVQKPWVNAELDAGFTRRLASRCRLLPVRFELSLLQLPALLSGMYSPSLDTYEPALAELIADIHDVGRKPPLGAPPAESVRVLPDEAGLSAAAGQIAQYFVSSSEKGFPADPQIAAEDLRSIVSLPDNELVRAVRQLEKLGYLHVRRTLNAGALGFSSVASTPALFSALDRFSMGWNPNQDARVIANQLLQAEGGGVVVQVLAEQLGWPPRRMNPASTELVALGAATPSRSGDPNFLHHYLYKNDETYELLSG